MFQQYYKRDVSYQIALPKPTVADHPDFTVPQPIPRYVLCLAGQAGGSTVGIA